jgi:hypothetical protein
MQIIHTVDRFFDIENAVVHEHVDGEVDGIPGKDLMGKVVGNISNVFGRHADLKGDKNGMRKRNTSSNGSTKTDGFDALN